MGETMIAMEMAQKQEGDTHEDDRFAITTALGLDSAGSCGFR